MCKMTVLKNDDFSISSVTLNSECFDKKGLSSK